MAGGNRIGNIERDVRQSDTTWSSPVPRGHLRIMGVVDGCHVVSRLRNRVVTRYERPPSSRCGPITVAVRTNGVFLKNCRMSVIHSDVQ